MTISRKHGKPAQMDALREPTISVATGEMTGSGASGAAIVIVPLAWALFQLWYASPLPFLLDVGIFNNTEARSIHLAFAVFLAYVSYPARRRSMRPQVPAMDWVLATVGAFCAAYLYLFYDALSTRPGAPTSMDLITGTCGILVLLEATRRALGPPLMIVALLFLVYTFGGPLMPEVIAHKGASLSKTISHQWLGTEGVFGIALGVSTSFVFLFVLFGNLLEKAGAGSYFIRVAFSLLGHMRGGPAKAAIVASGMTGLISGSSIANVVTTGTFTIPLMKRVGFSGTKAGAIEVAASTNGQLTPPIMGAAAFLMVEYVGITYLEVIKHALLPAAISYAALFYIVHLEAVKAGMQGIPRSVARTSVQTLGSFLTAFLALGILSAAVFYGVGWVKTWFGAGASWVIAVAAVLTYIVLLAFSTRHADEQMDEPAALVERLPEPGKAIKSGLHFLLPVVILVWCLTVERLSPGLSAFWATVFMMFIVVTQRPLQSFFGGRGDIRAAGIRGLRELLQGLVGGARNMIAIGVATAAAGIIVGTVTLTGIGLVMTEFVELVSGGNLLLMLLFTAAMCLLLGMGLPTTANYIVVSTLMAPVVVSLGAQHGLVVPLIAVHLFVFYFGILADDTPPVGLAAFAASAIAGSDPIRTGIQGFAYDIRTAILPFLFIFNNQLLLIGVNSPVELLVVALSSLAAMLLFAAAVQGYFMARSKVWESLALLLISFTLFRPGFWWDMVYPPVNVVSAQEIEAAAENAPVAAFLSVSMEGETLDGDFVRKLVALPMGEAGPGTDRLAHSGLELRREDGRVFVEDIRFGSVAEAAGVDFDWEVLGVELARPRPPKYLLYIPTFALLGVVAFLQRRRMRGEAIGCEAGTQPAARG